MKTLFCCLCLFPLVIQAANFKVPNSIACISDKSSLLGRHRQAETRKGPEIEVTTTEKMHNLLKICSHTRNSLIFVTSASSPFSTESWTFVLNFKIESLIATRVQSNIASVKGEVITYNCQFESLQQG